MEPYQSQTTKQRVQLNKEAGTKQISLNFGEKNYFETYNAKTYAKKALKRREHNNKYENLIHTKLK